MYKTYFWCIIKHWKLRNLYWKQIWTHRSGWGSTAFYLYAHYTIILLVTYIITQYTAGNRRLKILRRIADDQPRSCKNISSFGTSKKRSTSEKYLREKRVSFTEIRVLRVKSRDFLPHLFSLRFSLFFDIIVTGALPEPG